MKLLKTERTLSLSDLAESKLDSKTWSYLVQILWSRELSQEGIVTSNRCCIHRNTCPLVHNTITQTFYIQVAYLCRTQEGLKYHLSMEGGGGVGGGGGGGGPAPGFKIAGGWEGRGGGEGGRCRWGPGG